MRRWPDRARRLILLRPRYNSGTDTGRSMSTTVQASTIQDDIAAHAPAGPPAPLTAPVAKATRERLLSLDVFRGLTIAGMLLVNDPGSWGAIYSPLEHAAWNGWTPTDLIFPFFLFIAGVTTHLSLAARRA